VAVSAPTFDAGAEVKPLFVVLFNDMLVFAKTGAKLKREKGKATVRSVRGVCAGCVVIVAIADDHID
jgi:hypothetical protein